MGFSWESSKLFKHQLLGETHEQLLLKLRNIRTLMVSMYIMGDYNKVNNKGHAPPGNRTRGVRMGILHVTTTLAALGGIDEKIVYCNKYVL